MQILCVTVSCRLINTSDLASLPVVYRSRLFRAALRLVAFSADSAYLAAASADSGSVALLKVADAGQQVDLLGYFDVAGMGCCSIVSWERLPRYVHPGVAPETHTLAFAAAGTRMEMLPHMCREPWLDCCVSLAVAD